jgi:hypothetical protein
VLVGVYLLFMAGVGYYVRYFGGEWGRALQLALITGAFVALAAIMLSGALRARLKVFVSKNFFSYRYDYREEWLKFTRTLASSHAPQEVGSLIVKGLSSLVETPGGDLWTTDGATAADFRQTARWNVPAVAVREPVKSSFGRFPQSQGLGDRHARVPQRTPTLWRPGAAHVAAVPRRDLAGRAPGRGRRTVGLRDAGSPAHHHRPGLGSA